MANTKITSRVIADDAILTAAIADDQITSALIADDVALGGNPTTTTQSAGNNTTRIATTAFVSTAVSNLVDSSPDALNTLNELAAALGDDANFSTTVTNSIATKAALASPTFTGTVTIPALTMTGDIAHASNFTIDVGGNIKLNADGGQIAFEDGSTEIGVFENSSSNFSIEAKVQDKDILFKGNDGGSGITALTLDMSDAGSAYFNNKVGIGTTSPVAILQVKTQTNGNLAFQNSTSVSGGVKLNCFNDAANASSPFEIDGSSLQFNIGASEKMRLTNAGKLGIGETNPATNLTVKTAASESVANFDVASGLRYTQVGWLNNGTQRGAIWADETAEKFVFYAPSNWGADIYAGGSQRFRVKDDGNVMIGTTTAVSNARLTVDGGDMMVQGNNNSAGISDLLPGYTRGDYGVVYSTANNIYFAVGSSYISYIAGGSGQYTISDERMKENVTTLSGTLDKVKQLRGVSHTWKDTESMGADTQIGMIAQEVETIYPELVGDGGLPNDNEGNPPMKSVNYPHLTSVLVEAIKELSTKLDAAEARIKTLEDNA